MAHRFLGYDNVPKISALLKSCQIIEPNCEENLFQSSLHKNTAINRLRGICGKWFFSAYCHDR